MLLNYKMRVPMIYLRYLSQQFCLIVCTTWHVASGMIVTYVGEMQDIIEKNALAWCIYSTLHAIAAFPSIA